MLFNSHPILTIHSNTDFYRLLAKFLIKCKTNAGSSQGRWQIEEKSGFETNVHRPTCSRLPPGFYHASEELFPGWRSKTLRRFPISNSPELVLVNVWTCQRSRPGASSPLSSCFHFSANTRKGQPFFLPIKRLENLIFPFEWRFRFD